MFKIVLMKLKFRYALFILLCGTFIAADHVRAVDSEPSDNVRLDLFVQYPNVAWTSTHRTRFLVFKDDKKDYLLNACDAEKCEAVLSSDQFHFLHTCSMEEFKNLLGFPLDVVKNLLSHTPEEFFIFLHLNKDELNELQSGSLSRLLQFTSNPEAFPSILDVGLNYFRILNDAQLNNVFKIEPEGIKQLQRFFPEQIPVLLETEHLEKSKHILEALRNNYKKLETKPIMRLLNLPFDAVKRVMYGNDQQHHPFLKLNDDEFTTLRGFSDARIIEFASDSELFSSLLDVGLKSFQPLHDDQFNNVSKILSKNDIKELKRFAPEQIPVLLETEHLEKTKAILDCLRMNFRASQMLEPQTTLRFLHLPLEAVNCLPYYVNISYQFNPFLHTNDDEFINRQPHPFLHLNDDEFTTLRGFSDARIIQFASNPQVFSSLLYVGLEYFQPLHDDQFNNVFKIGLWPVYDDQFNKVFEVFCMDHIKELKRFTPEHIPVLLETENLKKTETILYCLRTNFQASQMLEPQTIMRFLHLPLDAVKKLMHTFDPQRHGPFLHLNDDEFNEFKKFSTDRMKKLIRHGEIFPDILSLGLEQVRNLPDDEFNTLINRTLDQVEQLR